MEPAYKVVARGEGCPTCQHGDQFDIIGPDECAQSQSWGNAEEAEYICELMNDAFMQGRANYARQILDTLNKDVKADASLEPEPEAVAPPPTSDDDIPS